MGFVCPYASMDAPVIEDAFSEVRNKIKSEISSGFIRYLLFSALRALNALLKP